MDPSSRAILSPDRDFYAIDGVLCVSESERGLSLLQNKIKEESLETIDLTGLGEKGVANLGST